MKRASAIVTNRGGRTCHAAIQVFTYQFIPNAGISLARLEFIISNMIRVHPNAVFQPDKLSLDEKQEMHNLTAGYPSSKEFYIEKMAEGVATIAAAFYSKPVIVRFSDFKSNEYANWLMQAGVTSMSLTPDFVIKTWSALCEKFHRL